MLVRRAKRTSVVFDCASYINCSRWASHGSTTTAFRIATSKMHRGHHGIGSRYTVPTNTRHYARTASCPSTWRSQLEDTLRSLSACLVVAQLSQHSQELPNGRTLAAPPSIATRLRLACCRPWPGRSLPRPPTVNIGCLLCPSLGCPAVRHVRSPKVRLAGTLMPKSESGFRC